MLKILIVDDSSFTRDMHREILEDAGYRVISAGSGAEAIEAVRKENPDVVILDLIMPDMDGMDVIQQLKEIAPRVKTVICSSDVQKYRREKAADLGVAGFFEKPLDPELLLPVLKGG